MATEETTGQRVKRLRLERGWTQRQLAEESGMDHTAISRIENGGTNPTRRTIRDLSAAFGVRPEELRG